MSIVQIETVFAAIPHHGIKTYVDCCLTWWNVEQGQINSWKIAHHLWHPRNQISEWFKILHHNALPMQTGTWLHWPFALQIARLIIISCPLKPCRHWSLAAVPTEEDGIGTNPGASRIPQLSSDKWNACKWYLHTLCAWLSGIRLTSFFSRWSRVQVMFFKHWLSATLPSVNL